MWLIVGAAYLGLEQTALEPGRMSLDSCSREHTTYAKPDEGGVSERFQEEAYSNNDNDDLDGELGSTCIH